MKIGKNIVLDKAVTFALSIIEFCELLEVNRKFVVANQLLKSGTSIGANLYEAQNAESRADFIHKVKIAAKEVEETKYWLLICEKSANYPFHEGLTLQIKELSLIIYKILSTSKKPLRS